MERPVLSDKDIYPSEEVVFSHIGKSSEIWETLFDNIQRDHPDFSKEWRYYNDGKSWLMKVTRKTKTIFWLSVLEGSFRTTFYFPGKAENTISESSLPYKLKKQFLEDKKMNKIRGITINFNEQEDVECAKVLMEMKISIK